MGSSVDEFDGMDKMSVVSATSVIESNCLNQNSVVEYVGGAEPSCPTEHPRLSLLDNVDTCQQKMMGSVRCGSS